MVPVFGSFWTLLGSCSGILIPKGSCALVVVVPRDPGSGKMEGGGVGPSHSGVHGDLFHPLLGVCGWIFFALSWICGFQQVPLGEVPDGASAGTHSLG